MRINSLKIHQVNIDKETGKFSVKSRFKTSKHRGAQRGAFGKVKNRPV